MLRTCIDTTNVKDSRLGPPLVMRTDMPFCQAIYSGVEGSEWENMYNKHAELHRAVSHKKAESQQGSQSAVVDERRAGKMENLVVLRKK